MSHEEGERQHLSPLDQASTVERTNHSTATYEAAFGEFVTSDDAQVIVDVGAGDSPFATEYGKKGKEVYRVDAQYEQAMPADADERTIAGRIQEGLPLEDGVADRAVSAFLFQHLPPQDRGPALREMLRVTKPDTGFVLVFPIFRPKAVQKIANAGQFTNSVAIGYPGDKGDLAERKLDYPTLALHNSDELFESGDDGTTPFDNLLQALDDAEAFDPKPSMGKLLRKIRIRRTGNTRFDTSGRS